MITTSSPAAANAVSSPSRALTSARLTVSSNKHLKITKVMQLHARRMSGGSQVLSWENTQALLSIHSVYGSSSAHPASRVSIPCPIQCLRLNRHSVIDRLPVAGSQGDGTGPSAAPSGESATLDPPYKAITQGRVEQAKRFHQYPTSEYRSGQLRLRVPICDRCGSIKRQLARSAKTGSKLEAGQRLRAGAA